MKDQLKDPFVDVNSIKFDEIRFGMEEKGYDKIVKFCLYRERCISEVRAKIRETELAESKHETVIQRLIDDGYLNEKRYAEIFVKDKFELKKWGRRKILYELKGKRIPALIIEHAIDQIDEEQYVAIASDLIEKKARTLMREKNPIAKKQKIMRYMLSKGFEMETVNEAYKLRVTNDG